MAQRSVAALRLSEDETSWLDERAADEGLLHGGKPNRSEVLRLALAYARQHMPRGYRPQAWQSPSTPIAHGGWRYDPEVDREGFAAYTAPELEVLARDRGYDFSAHPAFTRSGDVSV